MKQLIQRYPLSSEVASFLFLLLMLLFTSMVADQLMGQREAERLLRETVALFGRYHVFFLVVFGPWLETLLGQALPAVIGQVYIRQPVWRWLIIVVPFGLCHYESSAVVGSLFNGLGGGIILGYVYLKYMPRSHYRAILVTWMLHASANACILLSS
jgi:hypothetical protein